MTSKRFTITLLALFFGLNYSCIYSKGYFFSKEEREKEYAREREMKCRNIYWLISKIQMAQAIYGAKTECEITGNADQGPYVIIPQEGGDVIYYREKPRQLRYYHPVFEDLLRHKGCVGYADYIEKRCFVSLSEIQDLLESKALTLRCTEL